MSDNYDVYWNNTNRMYRYYPTILHRERFILGNIKKFLRPHSLILDYGCGQGGVLKKIEEKCFLKQEQLSGCDISKTAVGLAKQILPNSRIVNCSNSDVVNCEQDIIVCSEVIEHAEDYIDIIKWISFHLKTKGILILTTQTGRIHASDKYAGHKQHFFLPYLKKILIENNFDIKQCRLWGFPFFTMQKYLTNINFKKIKENYLEGSPTFFKIFLFKIVYIAYFIHDAINFGPQIYIVAEKRKIF